MRENTVKYNKGLEIFFSLERIPDADFLSYS